MGAELERVLRRLRSAALVVRACDRRDQQRAARPASASASPQQGYVYATAVSINDFYVSERRRRAAVADRLPSTPRATSPARRGIAAFHTKRALARLGLR
jgi:hypothetical protein